MSFTILTIKPNPLQFTEKESFVIIGINPINKKFYNEHKKTFDNIIKSGDQAWNNKIRTEELLEFTQKLDKQKQLLQLITN